MFGTYALYIFCMKIQFLWSQSGMRIPIRLLGDNKRFCTLKLYTWKAGCLSVTIQALAESWKPGNNGKNPVTQPLYYSQIQYITCRIEGDNTVMRAIPLLGSH